MEEGGVDRTGDVEELDEGDEEFMERFAVESIPRCTT
jgi:hypothetical protein